MSKKGAFARIFLLLASFCGSLDAAWADWAIENDAASASATLETDSKTKAVCYIGDTYYTSLDRALNVAESNETADMIYVIPNLGSPVYIKESHTVKNGDSLVLPYEGETYFDPDVHGTVETYKTQNSDGTETSHKYYFADQTADRVAKYRKTQVKIGGETNKVTLTIKGTLNIGGVLGQPDIAVAGETTGAYCEITMLNLSQIVCSSGTINCYGYIKNGSDSDEYKPSMAITDKGTLFCPFVIYDYKGGNITLAINNLTGESKYCPFQIFDFCNIQVKTQLYSESVWKTRACIYINTNKTYYPTTEEEKIINFIGPSEDNTALVLSSGYITVEYLHSDSETKGVTNEDPDFATTSITIAGKVSIGSIALSMSVYGKEVNIDTTDFFFPISYRLSFLIASGATLDVSKKVKLMNGAKLLVDAGGALNVNNSLIIYDGYTEITTSYSNPYPTGRGAANLTNKGKIEVNSDGAIGGTIKADSTGASLYYRSTNYSVSSPEYGGSVPNIISTLGGIPVSTISYLKTASGALTTTEIDPVFSNASSDIKYNDYKSVSGTSAEGSKAYGWYHQETISFEVINDLQTSEYGQLQLKAVVNRSDLSGISYAWRCKDADGNSIVFNSDGAIATITNYTTNEKTVMAEVTITDSLGSSESSFYNVSVNGMNTAALEDIKDDSLALTIGEYTGDNKTVTISDDKKIGTVTSNTGGAVFDLAATVEPEQNCSKITGYTWAFAVEGTSLNPLKSPNVVSFIIGDDKKIQCGVDGVTQEKITSTTRKDFSDKSKWIVYKGGENDSSVKFNVNVTKNVAYEYWVIVQISYTTSNGDSKAQEATVTINSNKSS